MNKAFVLVDYQNDFIDGSLGFEKALKIKKNILEALNHIDFNTMHLLVTYDTHDENYLKTREGLNLPVKHCIKDSFGWYMPQEFEPFLQKAHKIFHKNVFGSLELANFIEKSTYEEIHFAGLVSHICVFCNIILAFNAKPNARIILHQNLSASFDEKLEGFAFDILRAYGIEIL
ncbi:cysteine hydrolase family protein [Campylobacter hepaticus]|uniref:Cysteine hydrolase family protein n=1 Tax=Campylobacter hepaticus TaxID=1813019 RepID=A0A424Z122_9BACT|nr:cysteine hydrolase family protein [Campylobacter hepaticus]AXP09531.1 cysteine hydrolase family protein [Campylobacter hepaticus]MDX2323436.1 cysteine hydrolase family protein [Campylobacter hepaticus]MDX2331291.1 cysteine hydrolase family protein [Campylobacter hepaticus]MDX2332696.1 cysteine hydrolase family protein [Campylobacter hepaticus]MDX2371906.1 cysteine hydrolase family protein [Campylobacter hepaticus]